jgi:hypothetical protein
MVSVAFLAEESKAITAVPDDMVLINAGGFTRGVDNTNRKGMWSIFHNLVA